MVPNYGTMVTVRTGLARDATPICGNVTTATVTR